MPGRQRSPPRRRQREAECRAELDQQYVARFAERVRELFPNSPPGVEQVIAKQACQKYSGRVGRSAAAKNLDREAIHLAVIAHIRHNETDYDQLLTEGYERWEARDRVKFDIDEVLARWSVR